MKRGPDSWKDETREGAGKVQHAKNDGRLREVTRKYALPEEQWTRQNNFPCTEAIKNVTVDLQTGHDLTKGELLLLMVTAFIEKYGWGKARPSGEATGSGSKP